MRRPNLLVALGPVVGRIFILVQNFDFSAVLFLVSDSVLLYLSFQLYQVVPFLFQLLELLLVLLLISLLLSLLFLNQPPEVLNLPLLVLLELHSLPSNILLCLCYLANRLVLLLPHLCSNLTLLLRELIFTQISIKYLNFAVRLPPVSVFEPRRCDILFALGSLPTYLIFSLSASGLSRCFSDFFLGLLGKGPLIRSFIGDDEGLKVRWSQVMACLRLVASEAKHN